MSSEDRRPPYYLGIDLGGTNIKCGVVDDTGRPLIDAVSEKTEADRPADVCLENMARAARRAVEAARLQWDDIKAVGLGSPGTMDIAAGLLLDPVNFKGEGWRNLPIRDRLAAKLGKPVAFQNDANAAAYGEHWAGAGRGCASLVLFTLGTGIGCGIVEDGRVIEGRHSHGGECGHIVVQMEGGRLCGCGKRGHLEAYASATSVADRATEAADLDPISSLHALLLERRLEEKRNAREEGRSPKRVTISSEEVDQAAKAGDALARRLMRDTARYLAVGAVNLMHTIDPDIILYSGGMIAAGKEFLDQIRADIDELAFPTPAAHTRVEFAELGGNAGFIGAAGCARLRFPRA